MARKPIQLLIDAARKAHQAEKSAAPETAPFGFAGSVVAQSRGKRARGGLDFFERAAWWASGLSTAVCLAAFVHRQTLPEPGAFDLLIEGEAEVGNQNSK
jgi:hypothetical protein